MPVEAGHIQLTEYSKEVIPKLNYMMEDLFCKYSISIPYYLLDFSFPDYQLDADWPAPYSPEWLALYRPSLPPWPEFLWPNIPDWKLPEMKWPSWRGIQWPVLPEMAWPEWPDWPNWELPEWEWLDFYYPDWPEWDWPNWESPESGRTRRRRQREELLTELQKTKKRIPIGITPQKPPIELEGWPLIQKPDWFEGTGLDWVDNYNGYPFNINQGLYGYNLRDLNNLLETLYDEADLPVEQLNDLSDKSMELFNNMMSEIYEESEVTPTDYEFNSQTKDGHLEKYSGEGASWDGAWTAMKAATPDVYTSWTTVSLLLAGLYREVPPDLYWKAWVDRAYLSFDTSSLAGKTITAATIKFYITFISVLDDYETTRTINVYAFPWDTLDITDWDTGTLVGSYIETDLVLNAYYTVTLTDTSIINKTGETQFVFAGKADVDGDTFSDPQDLGPVGYRGGVSHTFSSGNATSNKPILTVTATG